MANRRHFDLGAVPERADERHHAMQREVDKRDRHIRLDEPLPHVQW